MINLLRRLFISSLLGLLYACSGGSSPEIIDVDVIGTVRYEDKHYDGNGFTGTTEMKPVRHAIVELVGSQGVVSRTTTDDFGSYAINGQGSGLYLRTLAQSDGDTGHPIEVVHASSPTQLFAVSTAPLTAGAATVDMDITLANAGPVVGVFNILDVYLSAGEFAAAHWAGDFPLLQVRWEECSINGTYTAGTSNPAIIIIGLLGVHSGCPTLPFYNGGIDTDEYDDDVLWHEYGHFLELSVGALDAPGQSHTITDTAQDIRLAWSEGWSNYLSGAIKAWLAASYPERLSIDTQTAAGGDGLPASLYVDTFGTAAFSYDFRTGILGETVLNYATNEGAIAKILWGIDDDSLFNFSTIWQVFSMYLGTVDTPPSSLEKVWDGWITLFSPTEDPDKMTMRAILEERQVFYVNDASESDNLISEANPLRPEPDFYTLFSGEGANRDIDLIPFSAANGSTYRVETYNLHNGADTYLRILNTGGTVVTISGSPLVNDNHTTIKTLPASPNDTCLFSSRIEFSAETSATYYAEISSSPDKPDAAGRFGDYQLLITENPPQNQALRCP